MSQEAVDIVISTCNQGARIAATVGSILRSTYTQFTLWVLDQSDDALSQKALAPYIQADERVRYLHLRNRGIAATRNTGVLLGSAPYILFTNDDCVVDPSWVAELVAELRNEQLWLVYGRVLPGPKPVEDANLVILAVKQSLRREVYAADRFNLGFGHGHNMGARREHFTALFGFDELFGAGSQFLSWDDLDIGYRAMRKGGRVVYTPGALVYHCHWSNWASVLQSYHRYGIGAGAAVAKYVRCGDPGAVCLLVKWIGYHGVRYILSGLIKQRSWGKVRVGLSQLISPWLGVFRSLSSPIDCQQILYQHESTPITARPNSY